MLFFDLSSMQPAEQVRAEKAARRFLQEQMTPNDLVAVMPRLRDAMLRELYRKPVVRNDGDGTINIDSVKTRMLAVAQGMLSAAKVQDVLIVKAIQVG